MFLYSKVWFVDVSILIVNYNTEKFIVELLQSLKSQTLPTSRFEIIIINNIKNEVLNNMILHYDFFSFFNLKIYDSGDNIGFGRAMNLAFSYSFGKHILLMNPDIKMIQNYYLENLLKFAKDSDNYGAISTKVINDAGIDTSTYYSYEFGQNLGFENEICWFQGSLMLIRREVYQKIGGFDGDFFMYCEDVDLCLRIKKQGLELLKNKNLEVYHFGGASEPIHDYNYYHRYFKSQLLFANKHYENDVFSELVLSLLRKSQKRLIFYHFLKIFSKRYQKHHIKNQVMYDICKRIHHQGADWLVYF